MREAPVWAGLGWPGNVCDLLDHKIISGGEDQQDVERCQRFSPIVSRAADTKGALLLANLLDSE